MKAKVIKAILTGKFNKFLDSITDEAVRDKVKRDGLITGGSIASLLLNEKVNDFDVYFTTQETAQAVAQYYCTKFMGAGNGSVEVISSESRVLISGTGLGADAGLRMDQDEVEDTGSAEAVDSASAEGKFSVLFVSPNAITLSDQIQIVIRFFGPAETIHENYDFVHCTNYWTAKDGELVLQQGALEALLTKELRYVGSKYPLCSIIRTRKFIKRGWTINAGQYLKMALQLNDLDLLDIETLQDQLIGVDSAHFVNLLAQIQAGNPEKINSTYICEIIDRIF